MTIGGGDKHPGMMGDGTEEQNLNQPGQPDARIKKDEVEDAFGGESGGKPGQGGPAGSADQKPKDNAHNVT